MVEGHVDGGMIEIGDPAEEPKLAEPPPRVVIEYRERGIPWMLVPPLLILSAVGAVLLYHKFAPKPARPQTVSLAKAPAIEEVKIPLSKGPLETGKPISTVMAPSTAPTTPAAKPAEPTAPPPVTAPDPVVTLPPPVAEPPAVPEKPADPPTLPRVQGLGFDPKALEADRKPEPTADGAISTASKEPQADQPASELDRAAPVERAQPTEVDPDLLPPDPREARARQKQRLVEALQQVEEDRARFHVDLKAVCRKTYDLLVAMRKVPLEQRKKPREEIQDRFQELIQKYGTQLEPASRKQAAAHLTGQYAGADRITRIDILRAAGFPETLILIDIYDNHEKGRIGERDGPLDDSEGMYRASLFLLRHPPGQKAAPTRAVSNTRPNPTSGTSPSAPPAGPGVR